MYTSMFYAADVAESSSKIYGGGTQDHGTLIAGVPTAPGEPPPPEGEFTRVLSSDGGWIEFDPTDAEHVFGTTTDLSIWRHQARPALGRGPAARELGVRLRDVEINGARRKGAPRNGRA